MVAKTSSFYLVHRHWVTAWSYPNCCLPPRESFDLDFCAKPARGGHPECQREKLRSTHEKYLWRLCASLRPFVFACVSFLEPDFFIGSYQKCMSVVWTDILCKYFAKQVEYWKKGNFLSVWKAAEIYIADCEHGIFLIWIEDCGRD